MSKSGWVRELMLQLEQTPRQMSNVVVPVESRLRKDDVKLMMKSETFDQLEKTVDERYARREERFQ